MNLTIENIYLLILAFHGLYSIYFTLLKAASKKIKKVSIDTNHFYLRIVSIYFIPIIISGILVTILGKIVNSLTLYFGALIVYIALKILYAKMIKQKFRLRF